MGRHPDPPPRPEGRYGYTAPSDPPDGLRRRREEAPKPYPLSMPPRSEPTSGPTEEQISKLIRQRAIGKIVEWATGILLAGLVALVVAGWGWITSRPSAAQVQAVSDACEKSTKELTARIAAEEATRIDAGSVFGDSLNKQDAINRHVWEITRKKRDETPPSPIGPKAQQEGRQ
jgi:hypothetical protein